MALQFSHDRMGGVSRELDTAFGVETVDGLYEAQGSHLHEIVQRFPAVGETPGKVFRQSQMRGYEFIAQRRIVSVSEGYKLFP
jgi:hypothetical protein